MNLTHAKSKPDDQVGGILFVASREINSEMARRNLEAFCRDKLFGNCQFDTVDVFEDMELAVREGIIVTPALLITRPEPRRVIVGNLSNIEQLADILNIETRQAQNG
ncbi:MAG: circadian clock KaiB family protein [Phycisphaerae bacterium]